MKWTSLVCAACFVGAGGWTVATGCGGERDVFGESTSSGAAVGGSGGTGSPSGGGNEGSGAGAPVGGEGHGGKEPGKGDRGGTEAIGSGGDAPVVTCGDFVCDPSECGQCAPDCGATCQQGCGDGECSEGESCASCPADCQLGCGDGCCLLGEDCQSCPADCDSPEECNPEGCGNGQCNHGLGETCLNCVDCFGLCGCGDELCTPPETDETCPWDCGD